MIESPSQRLVNEMAEEVARAWTELERGKRVDSLGLARNCGPLLSFDVRRTQPK